MKKLFQKKNNKGFSLVELIVVVAIMAVLMGVLIPTLITNVEKTKHQKDISALSEVLNAFNIEMTDETYSGLTGKLIYKVAANGSFVVTAPDSSSTATGFTTTKTQAKYLDLVSRDLVGNDAAAGSASFSYQFGSKMKDGEVTVEFTFAGERCTGKVTSAKYGDESLQ